jgi:hypothetical protein
MRAPACGSRHQRSGLLLQLDLVAQRDPVSAHLGDLRLEAGAAAGRRLVGGLPRTDLHRINVTAVEQGAIAPPAESLATGCGGPPSTPHAADASVLRPGQEAGKRLEVAANGFREGGLEGVINRQDTVSAMNA